MSFHNNDPSQFKLSDRRTLKEIKKYIDNSFEKKSKTIGVGINELINTNHNSLRIRSQLKDIGAYEIEEKSQQMKIEIDSIFNPNRESIENYYDKFITSNNENYIDSIIFKKSSIVNALTKHYSNSDEKKQYEFDINPQLIKSYYSKNDFKSILRESINAEYFDITLTGTSIVASNGTQYMVINLFTSLVFSYLY